MCWRKHTHTYPPNSARIKVPLLVVELIIQPESTPREQPSRKHGSRSSVPSSTQCCAPPTHSMCTYVLKFKLVQTNARDRITDKTLALSKYVYSLTLNQRNRTKRFDPSSVINNIVYCSSTNKPYSFLFKFSIFNALSTHLAHRRLFRRN